MEELQASILERQSTVDDAAQMLSFVRVLSKNESELDLPKIVIHLLI